MKKFILIISIIQCLCLSTLWGENSKNNSASESRQNTQKTRTVHGKIVDEKGEPVIGANISISETSTGTISNLTGEFSLEIPTGTKLLKISYIGYMTLEVAPEKEMKVSLQPDVTQISEVVVVGKKQAVQITAEKTTVFPGLSPTTSSGSAYSVLKNLPGVIVNSDGTVYLNGKSGVNVLVDSKNTYLSGTDLVNYLMSLPANSLNKIELINHPSAKYEAAGNAGIIDICTKKSNTVGYNINVNTNYEQGKYGKSNNNIAFGYRQNKFNLNAMYGYYFGNDFVDLTVNREYSETATASVTFFDQDSYRKRKDKSHYFNFGVDFYANSKTTLGMALRGSNTNRIENGTLNSIFYTQTTKTDSTVYSSTNNDENRKNLTSSLYFQHKIDSLGKEISASADGLYYSVDETQWHDDVLSKPSRTSSESVSQALKDGTIKMASGRVDMTWPINDKLRFDGGIKSDFVKIDNTSNYENEENDQWVNDPTLSNVFQYKENINAAYLSSKMQKNKLIAEIGLRVENTNIDGGSFTQSYTNFFPNLMLSWQLQNSNALNFTYDKRIDRPNYRYLNPFVYIFDNYTYEQGNTELKPQYTDRLNFSYTLRKNYKFSLFYSNTKQVIMKSYIVQSGSKRVYVMPTNMASYNSYGVQADIAQLSFTRWLQTSVHSELVQNNYKWDENGYTFKNEDLSFQIGLQNHVRLPFGWSGEVSGFYNSRMAYGQIDVLPIWQVSGGIQKSFFEGCATLSIFSNDWFHTNRTRIKGIINGSHVTTDEFDDRAILGLSFSYRFKKGLDIKKQRNKENINSKRIDL